MNQSYQLAPIVLFVYNRPWHTKQTLEALANNHLAIQSTLFIYADGPKIDATQETLEKIEETRGVIREKQWCKEVNIIESNINKGLADSIVSGVTDIVNKYGRVIVLEDDIVTSKGFLKYMNDALQLYENKEKVMHISGFIYPINISGLPETYFYNVNSCWGWATWSRAWKHFNRDAKMLLDSILKKKNFNHEDFNGGQNRAFFEQLVSNTNGSLNTWAAKWHASMYLLNGLCLHPRLSLVCNIGFDNSGVHCTLDERLNVQTLTENIRVEKIPLRSSDLIVKRIKEYNQKDYQKLKSRTKLILYSFKIYSKIKIILNRIGF